MGEKSSYFSFLVATFEKLPENLQIIRLSVAVLFSLSLGVKKTGHIFVAYHNESFSGHFFPEQQRTYVYSANLGKARIATSLLDTTTGVTNEEYDTWFSEVVVINDRFYVCFIYQEETLQSK